MIDFSGTATVADALSPCAPRGDLTPPVQTERPKGTGRRLRGLGGGTGLESSTVQRVMAYVDAHYAERISLRDVARELAYSPAHLTDVVRRLTGTAVTAWIIKRRVDAARDLLGNHNLTVAAVCERVGFNDLCYFTRQFVRLTGTTPGRYRASLRRVATAGGRDWTEDGAIARSGSR